MTKKDYIAIAKVIASNQELFGNLDELSKDLCEVFIRDNPRFDIVRFMKATRLPVDRKVGA